MESNGEERIRFNSLSIKDIHGSLDLRHMRKISNKDFKPFDSENTYTASVTKSKIKNFYRIDGLPECIIVARNAQHQELSSSHLFFTCKVPIFSESSFDLNHFYPDALINQINHQRDLTAGGFRNGGCKDQAFKGGDFFEADDSKRLTETETSTGHHWFQASRRRSSRPRLLVW